MALREVVPSDLIADVGLENGDWIDDISGPESRLGDVEEEVRHDHRTVVEYEQSCSEARRHREAEWAHRRVRTIEEEPTLSFLSRKAVIPKYGFPVDVVELDTQRASNDADASTVQLQRDLSLAIAEYAPTSRVVANKSEWESYALKRVPDREWERKSYLRCPVHNIFEAWDPMAEDGEAHSKCCSKAIVRTYVIPKFGFQTTRDRARPPKRRSARVFTTRPYFIGRLSGAPPVQPFPAGIHVQSTSPGRMVVLCEGFRGRPFYICASCGAGFRSRVGSHSTPYGSECRGSLFPCALGHQFDTDVVTLLFPMPQTPPLDTLWFAYSLAYSLVEGATASDALGVPATDLNVVVGRVADAGMAPIILYDNVPGGAGLVTRLEDETVLHACLAAACERVAGGCGCGEEESCYGCLRSYRNQFAHPKLARGPVADYLQALLAGW